MHKIFRTTIIGVPIPKGRPRFNRYSGRSYTPYKTKKAEESIRLHLECIVGGDKQYPLNEALHVDFEFYLKRPQALYRRKDSDEAILHLKKPDLSNLIKTPEDAANGVLWTDDAIISKITARKFYAAKKQEPQTIITIYRINDVIE